MSEQPNVSNMLAEAERAANSGDLASAEELLSVAAQLQEQELGPSHPDLANTLNNLAIIAETTGRLGDAETFYRRAVAIASASLPPDAPMVAASRKNLEDFCRAHGLAIEKPAIVEPAAVEAPAQPVPRPPPPPLVVPQPLRAPAMLGIGLAVLVTTLLLIARPWSPRHSSTAAPAVEPTPAPAAEPAPPRPAPDAPAPIDRTPPPTPNRAPAESAPAAISLVTVQLCRNFSTSDWRCDPAGDSVAPGPIVLYTRVRSPRDGVVVHRWFQGDTLRKSAQLRVGANAVEGYRTFSRQSVDRGEWRVEVRTAAGDLLHEQRFAVR